MSLRTGYILCIAFFLFILLVAALPDTGRDLSRLELAARGHWISIGGQSTDVRHPAHTYISAERHVFVEGRTPGRVEIQQELARRDFNYTVFAGDEENGILTIYAEPSGPVMRMKFSADRTSWRWLGKDGNEIGDVWKYSDGSTAP